MNYGKSLIEDGIVTDVMKDADEFYNGLGVIFFRPYGRECYLIIAFNE